VRPRPNPLFCQLSGLENVVFNDFIDDELDSEDVSEQRASASLPDSVPIESEEERAARETDEMAALDSVGDYEADPNVMLEDVPQHIVIKTLTGVVCMCSCVGASGSGGDVMSAPPTVVGLRSDNHECVEGVCVLLLQDLLQSCARGGRRRVEDMCYERRRAEACVDESAHHAHEGV
jgi:hypothetical protein